MTRRAHVRRTHLTGHPKAIRRFQAAARLHMRTDPMLRMLFGPLAIPAVMSWEGNVIVDPSLVGVRLDMPEDKPWNP